MNKKTAFILIAVIVITMAACPTPASNDSGSNGTGLSATFVETTAPTAIVKGVYTITINGTAARDCTMAGKFTWKGTNYNEGGPVSKGTTAAEMAERMAGGINSSYLSDEYAVTQPSANSVRLEANAARACSH